MNIGEKSMSETPEDDFSDLLYYSKQSLKKIWDNKKDDEVWSEYLAEG